MLNGMESNQAKVVIRGRMRKCWSKRLIQNWYEYRKRGNKEQTYLARNLDKKYRKKMKYY